MTGPLNVEGEDLSGSAFRDVNLNQSQFHNVRMDGVSLTDIAAVGADVGKCDLTGLAVTDTRLANARFDNVNLTNVQITNANLAGMTIDGVLVTDLLALRDRLD